MLLRFGPLPDLFAFAGDLRIDTAEAVHHEAGERRQGRLTSTEQPGVTHRPPEDPPHHVPPALVARVDPIAEQKGHRAGVIRQHPVRGAGTLHGPGIGPADQRPDLVEQGEKQVGMEIVVGPLEHRGNPFETGAGVDRRPRQRGEGPVGRTIVLHEHEIPDLQKPARLGVAFEILPCDGPGAGPGEVDVDLRAGAAGPGVGHLPEIVLVAQPVDPVVGQSGQLAP